MSFEDKTLECVSCGRTFDFTAGEQEFFASKGFSNEPRRCPSCRESRRRDRGGSDGYGYRPRQMYPAVCASCGQDTQVPFEPREGRPVYCETCYAQSKQ